MIISMNSTNTTEMEKVRQVLIMKKMKKKKKKGTMNRFFSSQKQRQFNNNNNQSSISWTGRAALNINGGGDVDVSERSKKHKFGTRRRRGGGSSTGSDHEQEQEQEEEEEEKEKQQQQQQELRSSLPLLSTVGGGPKNRVQLHTKPLSDCNGVDHAVIPRKLRSAMSKRSRESLSPPLSDAKKHHHHTYTNGADPFQINATAKKSKQKMKHGGRRSSHQFLGQGTSSQITKDEEEVVETLFALARMSQNNKHDKSSRVDQPISEPKSCPLLETTENPVLSSEVPEEVGKRTISIEATNLSFSVSEESAKYGLRANSLTESSVLDRDTISANKKSKLGLHCSISPPDPRGSSLLSNTAETEDIPMVIAAKSPVSYEHGVSNRSTHASQHKASFSEQNPELLPVAANVMEQEGQPPIKNEDSDVRLTCIEGTLALWPRLSMAVSGGGEVPRSSATKPPVCLDATASIAKHISKEEVNPDLVDRNRSLKKCATHVYLSRLILVYQASEKKHMFSVASDQLKLNEGTKLGAAEATSLIEPNNGCNGLIPIDIRNGLSGVIAIGNTGKSMNEAQTEFAKDNRLQAYRQQSSLNLTLEKQSCDFLSLSVSSGGVEPINDIKQEKTGLESSAQVRVPYLHPIVQNVQLMPFPYHARSSPSTYPDQLTVAVAQQLQFQLPQHMSGGPFYGQQHLIQAGSAKQHQQMWAAQYMPGGNPSTHLSKWQQGSSQRDSPLMISCAEPLLASSSLPPEVFSSKFPPGQQHQQQFFAVSSQSHNYKGKRQQQHPHQRHHQFSGVYEGGAGGLHSESLSNHLQLVCNAGKL